MRGAMPDEESVLLLMGKTARDKKSCLRQVPRIDLDETLFPPEKAAPQPEYTTSGCYDPKQGELAEMARSASAVAEDDEPNQCDEGKFAILQGIYQSHSTENFLLTQFR